MQRRLANTNITRYSKLSQTLRQLFPFNIPAEYFVLLPPLALLAVPVAVISCWLFEHTFVLSVSFGWDACGELALPLGVCICATLVFLLSNPIHSLLSLLGVFFLSVLFYFIAGIVFVGFGFLLIYVGAVAILFLFVIMLLNAKSLTARELLILHTSQYLSLLGANLLLNETYVTAIRALDRTLTGDHLRLVSLEGSSGEAVAFYVRFIASDINALTALYTVHTPLFLIITGVLLVSLIGAIILATMTTERPLSPADLRIYATNLINRSSRALVAARVPAAISGACVVANAAGVRSISEVFEIGGLLLMSFYEPWDRKNRIILQAYPSALESDSFLIKRLRSKKRILTKRATRWVVTSKNEVTRRQPKATVLNGRGYWKRTRCRVYTSLRYRKRRFSKTYKKAKSRHLRLLNKHSYWRNSRWKLRKKKSRALWRRKRAVKAMRRQAAINSLLVRLRARVLVRGMRRAPRLQGRVRRRAFRRLILHALIVRKGWNPRPNRDYTKNFTPQILTPSKLRAVYSALYKFSTTWQPKGKRKTLWRQRWLWNWRPERATSLVRERRYLTREAWYKDAPWKRPRWLTESVKKACPITPKTVGFVEYLRFLYLTKVVSAILPWAWRIRAFCVNFCYFLLVTPIILLPLPWIVYDMDIAWYFTVDILVDITRAIENWFPSSGLWSVWKHRSVVALLYIPCAAATLVFRHPWLFVVAVGLFSYDHVLWGGGQFVRAEDQESECNYFRLGYVMPQAQFKEIADASDLWRSRIHPDTGVSEDRWWWLLIPIDPSFYKYAFRISHYIETVILPLLVELQLAIVSFSYWVSEPGVKFHKLLGYYPNQYVGFAPIELTLLVVGLAFVISSAIISHYWRLVYSGNSAAMAMRPSRLITLVVFLVWTYALIVYLRCGNPLHITLNLPIHESFTHYYNQGEIMIPVRILFAASLWLVFLPLAYRWRLVVRYEWMYNRRVRVLRRFINDYIQKSHFVRDWRQLDAQEDLAMSREEVLEDIAVLRDTQREDAQETSTEHCREREVHPTAVRTSHEPHPQRDKFKDYWHLQVALKYKNKNKTDSFW